MHRPAKIRTEGGKRESFIALLFLLAVCAERAASLPYPIRRLVLYFLRKGEAAGYRVVYWKSRECGAPLQWALPDEVRHASDPDAALILGRWFRMLGLALRDLPRRAFIVRKRQAAWRPALRNTSSVASQTAPVCAAHLPDT